MHARVVPRLQSCLQSCIIIPISSVCDDIAAEDAEISARAMLQLCSCRHADNKDLELPELRAD